MTRAMIQLPIELSPITGFLVRLACAVTAALLCAFVAAAMSRRLSAALRHKIWSLAIVVSLLIPAVLLLAPERRFGLIGSNASAIEPLVPARTETTHSQTFAPAAWETASVDSNERQVGIASLSAAAGSSKLPNAITRSLASTPLMWLSIAWSIPALLLIARLIAGAIASRSIVRRATPVDFAMDDFAIAKRLRATFSRSLADQMPTVLESQAMQSPLCVGWFRSTILLPSHWRTWSRDQLRAVLIHESAHVARRDVLWQAIARLSCALYWPHPLIWFATRRMRIERELACDDWVVRGGASPTQYSRWLLDLACELKAARTLERLGVAMAGRNALQTRVQAALDPARRRMPLSRPSSILLTLLAAILLALTGTLSPLKAVQTPTNKPDIQQSAIKDPPTTPPSNTATPSTQPTNPHDDQELRFVMGQVLDESGKGVAGARVTIPPTPPYPAAHSVSADADGKFVLTIEPRKVIRLTLFAESRDGKLQSLVTLPRPRQNTEGKFAYVRIDLRPAAEFPITVVDAANHPVTGAKIIAGLVQLQTTSDANGNATLRLPAGQSPNFIMARKEDTGLDYVLFARANAPRVDPSRLAPNYVGPIHFILNGMRTINVKALDDKARPLAGVGVNARVLAKAGKASLSLTAASSGETVETDASGIAHISVPSDVDKPVVFTADLSGYSQSGSTSWNPKAPSDEVKIVLFQRPTFHLSVIDVDGKPAGGAQVMLVDDHGSQTYGVFNNGPIGPDGTTGGMLAPNTYYMFAAMKGQTASDPVMQISRPGDPPIRIELKLKPAVRVHGQLTAGNPRAPVANGNIHVQFDDNNSYKKLPPDQRLPDSAVGPRGPHPAVMFNRPTDNQGNFELYLAPGTYHFIDPNELGTSLLKGQTFTVPSDHPDLKVDVHYKTTQRVIAR